jgi:hypothetical protein
MISKQQSDEPSSDEPPKLTAVEKEKLAKHTNWVIFQKRTSILFQKGAILLLQHFMA